MKNTKNSAKGAKSMATATETVLESVIAESLQDARALQRRSQDGAQALYNLSMQGAIHLHQQTMSNAEQLRLLAHQSILRGSTGDLDVAASYRGSHLKKGAEVDIQEATAESTVVKGEAAASLPQTMVGHGSAVADVLDKLTAAIAIAQQLVKTAQTTPPETGKA